MRCCWAVCALTSRMRLPAVAGAGFTICRLAGGALPCDGAGDTEGDAAAEAGWDDAGVGFTHAQALPWPVLSRTRVTATAIARAAAAVPPSPSHSPRREFRGGDGWMYPGSPG